jgi:hypothetical protein
MESKIEKLLSEYVLCAEICNNTDYSINAEVKKHNDSVERMYQIVSEVNLMGEESINQFTQLLNDSNTSKWLAHQLIEKAIISEKLKTKCIDIIKELAKENSANGLGEKIWLQQNGFTI